MLYSDINRYSALYYRLKTRSCHLMHEKVFDNVQHLFVIKILRKKRNRGELQIDKGHLQKPCSSHFTLWQKTKCLSPKIKYKARMTALTTLIQHGPRSFSQYYKVRKDTCVRKEEIKLTLFVNSVRSYTKNPKEYIKRK